METEIIQKTIQELLERMGFENDLNVIEVHQGATTRFSVYLRESGGMPLYAPGDVIQEDARHTRASLLIGERGTMIAALEHVIKCMLRKKYNGDIRFTLDINDYRMRGLEDLKQDVKAAAKEVRTYHKEVPLRPMSSFERRIVHLLLAEYPDITTESIGQDSERRVVIKPYNSP